MEMVSDLKNLMTMQCTCQDRSQTLIADPQRSARINETAEEEIQAEVTDPENHEEALSPAEVVTAVTVVMVVMVVMVVVVVVVVVVVAEAPCHGFETALARIDEMTKVPFLSQF